MVRGPVSTRATAERARPFVFVELVDNQVGSLQMGPECLDPERHSEVRDTLNEVLSEAWNRYLGAVWERFSGLLEADPDPVAREVHELVTEQLGGAAPRPLTAPGGNFPDTAAGHEQTGRVVARVHGGGQIHVEFEPALLHASEREVEAALRETVNAALTAHSAAVVEFIGDQWPEEIDLSGHVEALRRLREPEF